MKPSPGTHACQTTSTRHKVTSYLGGLFLHEKEHGVQRVGTRCQRGSIVQSSSSLVTSLCCSVVCTSGKHTHTCTHIDHREMCTRLIVLLSYRTATAFRTLEPFWGEEYTLHVPNEFQNVSVHVYDDVVMG